MRTLLALTVAVTLSGADGGGAAPQTDQRAYCARIYQSYDLQLQCVQRESAARERLYRAGNVVAQGIWDYCGRIYNGWDLMEQCVAREETAKRQLGR